MATNPNQTITVQISPRTVGLVLGIVALIWLAFLIGDFLILLFASLVVATALAPFVRSLENRGLPRWSAVALIYLVLLAFLTGFIWLVLPPLTQQIGQLAADWPKVSRSVQDVFRNQPPIADLLRNSQFISGDLSRIIVSNVVSFTTVFVNGFVTTIAFFVITFYLLLNGRKVFYYLLDLLPHEEQRTRISRVVAGMSERMGYWFRGQFIVASTTFIVTFLILTILQVPYALTLALVAGMAEFIPLFGSWVGSVPAVLVAITQSLTVALACAGFIFLWQIIQANIIVPQIMRKVLGIPSILVFTSVLVLAKLIGLVGVFLAAPIAAAIGFLAQEFSDSMQARVRLQLSRSRRKPS